MTLLALEQFNGVAPKLNAKKIADTLAVKTDNTRLDRGVLEPWKGISFVEAGPAGTVASVFRYQNAYITSAFRRQYVRSLRPNDQHERIYFTDSDYPKLRSGAAEYRLGLPRPGTPAVTVTDAGNKDNITDIINTRYRVTLVDAFGIEGPPSPRTAGVEIGKDHTVTLDLTPCAVTGNYNLGTGAKFRIYRSNTGSEDAIYQYVDEVAYGSASYVDTIPSADLQEEMPSLLWNAAPDDDITLYPDGPLQSLVELPGGILAGHTGNTVFLSEPGVPTAWPYYYPLGQDVVGLVLIQGGIFVATKGRPYLLTGNHPDAMVPIPIESNHACVSQASIVDMGEFAIYASPDGLVIAQGNNAELLTGEILDKESWAAFEPETIRAFPYEGKYLAFYGTPAGGKGFVFDLAGGKNSLVPLTSVPVNGAFYEHNTDKLHVAYVDGAGAYQIGLFNEGAALSYDRLSKEFMFADPVALSIIRVEAESYPVTVEIIADGVSKGSWTFNDNSPVRLPGGYRARMYQIGVRGTGVVSGVYLADNMQEMV